MKKRIDQLQAENQTMKSELDRQRATVSQSSSLLVIHTPFRMIPIGHSSRKQQNQQKKSIRWVKSILEYIS